MNKKSLINEIADNAKVTRTWLSEEFEAEVEEIAEAKTPEEREDAVIYLTNVIDEQIRRLEKVKTAVIMAGVKTRCTI